MLKFIQKSNLQKYFEKMLIVLFFTSPIFSPLFGLQETLGLDLGESGRLVISHDPGMLQGEGIDRLLLKTGSNQPIEIFSSEGGAISALKAGDIDGDGVKEVLLVLDPGGSGGYSDLVLLQRQAEVFKTIWELEGLQGAKAFFADLNGDGKKDILIRHVKAFADMEGFAEKTSVFTFFKGKISPLSETYQLPQSEKNLSAQARDELLRGLYKDAAKHAANVIEKLSDPEEKAFAAIVAANALLLMEKVDDARVALEKIGEPKNDGVFQDEAKLLLSIIQKAGKKGSILLPAWKKAEEAVRNKEFDKAIDHAKKIVSEFPGSCIQDKAYYLMGEAYRRKGMPREAIEELNKLIKEVPSSNLKELSEHLVADLSILKKSGAEK
ncbi:tetratricopeptide repeat protein [bacterium]|nr:tetratricopeptide repeat protein [bacterium]